MPGRPKPTDRVATATQVLVPALASIAVAWLLFQPHGNRMLGVAAVAAAALALPAWAALVVALALASGWGSIVGASVPSGSTALAVVFVACLLIRAARRAQLSLSASSSLVVCCFLGIPFLVAVVDGNGLTDRGVWRASFPYLLALLAALRLGPRTFTRLFGAFSAFGVLYCTLFLLWELTPIHVLPGVATTQQATLAGTLITRVQTYGQLVPTFAFLWSVASLLARRGSRRSNVFVAALSLATVVAGLGRTALIALLLAAGVMAVVAARNRPGARRTAVNVLAGCTGTFAIVFLALSERLSGSYQELASGSGSWGARLAEWHARAPIVANHLLLGVGFDATQPGLGTSDSSLASALVRFGFAGLAVVVVVAALAFRRASRLPGDHRDDAPRDGVFVCGGISYLVLAAATTGALYYPLGVALFGLLVSRAWAEDRAPRPRVEPVAAHGRVPLRAEAVLG